MSDLIVEICKIGLVMPHTNADKLELAEVKGWQVAVPKGQYHTGDKILYVPPDAILPLELSEQWGVTKYLSKQRVRSIKLRGEVSHGFITDAGNYPTGQNLCELLKIVKWEPPVRECEQEDETWRDSLFGRIKHHINIFIYQKLGLKKIYQPVIKGHPLFHKFTDIQNLRNFPNVLTEGELVSVSEKIHGTNSRMGIVRGKFWGTTFLVGSHNMQRKVSKSDKYSFPLWQPGVRELLTYLLKEYNAKCVILFNEIFGSGIQDLRYGMENGKIGYRVFDISIDGKYLNTDDFEANCQKFGLPVVPSHKYVGWDMTYLKDLANSKSEISGAAEQIKEGIVIKPVSERYNEKVGRVVLKYISDSYLLRKDGTEFH